MFIQNWKKEIFTVPNLLSLLRLILIPVYITTYLKADAPKDYCTAGIVLSISCLTDAVDGRIARQFNMVSTLGKILDPVADKLTQFTLILCLNLRYPVLKSVLILFAVKELFQLYLGAYHLIHGKMLAGALPAGKICTTVLFVSLIILIVFPDFPPAAVKLIAYIDGVFLLFSFSCYLMAYLGKSMMIHDLNTE